MKVYFYETPVDRICALCGSFMCVDRPRNPEGSLFPFSVSVYCAVETCAQYKKHVAVYVQQAYSLPEKEQV